MPSEGRQFLFTHPETMRRMISVHMCLYYMRKSFTFHDQQQRGSDKFKRNLRSMCGTFSSTICFNDANNNNTSALTASKLIIALKNTSGMKKYKNEVLMIMMMTIIHLAEKLKERGMCKNRNYFLRNFRYKFVILFNGWHQKKIMVESSQVKVNWNDWVSVHDHNVGHIWIRSSFGSIEINTWTYQIPSFFILSNISFFRF